MSNAPLITETVPTIVGMGIVYKTTETMFGKNKSKKRVSTMTSSKHSKAAKKAWRTRKKRYGKDGKKG